MTKKELRALALTMQERAAFSLLRGCFTDIWLGDKVSYYPGSWAVTVRVDDLMELCAAVLDKTK
tara:strand:- start:75 stop:266 length:192 start_codon:yes stop_codon:yes gene_type:complete